MRKRAGQVLTALVGMALAVSMVPVAAYAGDGAETIVIPSSEGVTNPMASWELVDPSDAVFYLYTYGGSEQLTFDGAYPYYDTYHTVTIKLTGVDPTRPCDDNIRFFSGNECCVVTEAQDMDGSHGDYRTVTVKRGGYGGPAPYRLASSAMSSPSEAPQVFKAESETVIPTAITLNEASKRLSVGQAVKLVTSGSSECTWASTDAQVASVTQSGWVTGLADGTCTVTATYSRFGLELVASCEVTVGAGKVATPPASSSKAVGTGYRAVLGSGATKATYQVTSAKRRTVAYVKCAASGKVATVPAKVKINGTSYRVVKVAAKAFKGSKVTTLKVKASTLASKASVKKSLKGSKVKTVKTVSFATFKRFFTKANCGRSVKVKKLA